MPYIPRESRTRIINCLLAYSKLAKGFADEAAKGWRAVLESANSRAKHTMPELCLWDDENPAHTRVALHWVSIGALCVFEPQHLVLKFVDKKDQALPSIRLPLNREEEGTQLLLLWLELFDFQETYGSSASDRGVCVGVNILHTASDVLLVHCDEREAACVVAKYRSCLAREQQLNTAWRTSKQPHIS